MPQRLEVSVPYAVAWAALTVILAVGLALSLAWHFRRARAAPNLPNPSTGLESVYEETPATKAAVLFAGDSVVFRFPLAEFLYAPVMNRGAPGETSTGLVVRIDELKRHKPEMLIILTGANDVSQGVQSNVVVQNVRAVATAQIAPKVLVLGILPAKPDILPTAKVKEVNDALAANAPSWGATYIAPPADYTAEKDTFDGLHPNGAGYKLIAVEIRKHL